MNKFTVQEFINSTRICLGCGTKTLIKLNASKKASDPPDEVYDLYEHNNWPHFKIPRVRFEESIIIVDSNNNLMMDSTAKGLLTRKLRNEHFAIESTCDKCNTFFITNKLQTSAGSIQLLDIFYFDITNPQFTLNGTYNDKMNYSNLCVPWIISLNSFNVSKIIYEIQRHHKLRGFL